MKKQILAVLFLFFGALLLSAQELPVIQIANYTGFDVYGVFVSSSDSEELGDNILDDFDGEILGNADSIEILLHNPLDVIDTYDIFLLDENSSWYVKLGVKLSGDALIIFTSEDLI